MHCRDKAFIVAERVYFKTQCIYISPLSWDTTLISSQMRSCYVFSVVSPPLERWSIRLHYLERGERELFLSRFTIYLVTRLFAAFLPSHGGCLTWNASSSQFNTGFTIQAIWLQQNVCNSAILVLEKNCFPKRERVTLLFVVSFLFYFGITFRT